MIRFVSVENGNFYFQFKFRRKGFYSKGRLKAHPFFHSEQPKAVFPLIICPFPHNGQTAPSKTCSLERGAKSVPVDAES